jgi:MFS family permease
MAGVTKADRTDANGSAGTAGPNTTPPNSGGLKTFSSLSIRDYRWLWIGYLFSFGAIMMQMVARGWLVVELTDSAFLLGLVWSMWGFSVLIFSPIGGVIADRMDKRNLLIIAQAGIGAVTVAMAVLIQFDLIQFWHLLAGSFLSGVIFAFMMPARQAFIADLVGDHELMNAIALSTSAMNLMRVAAPAIGGILVELIDVSGVYWVIVVFYFFVIASLLMIKPRGVTVPKGGREGMVTELVGGFRHVWERRALVSLLIVAFLAVFLGWNYVAFMPAIAADVLKTGASGFGILMAASGIGALAGSLGVASMGNYRWKGAVMTGALIAFALTLIVFGFVQNYFVAIGLISVVGLTSFAFMTVNNTLVQILAAPHMRGRVVSLMMMTWGFQSFGVLPFGFLADQVSIGFAIGLGGALLLIGTLIVLAFSRTLIFLSGSEYEAENADTVENEESVAPIRA